MGVSGNLWDPLVGSVRLPEPLGASGNPCGPPGKLLKGLWEALGASGNLWLKGFKINLGRSGASLGQVWGMSGAGRQVGAGRGQV